MSKIQDLIEEYGKIALVIYLSLWALVVGGTMGAIVLGLAGEKEPSFTPDVTGTYVLVLDEAKPEVNAESAAVTSPVFSLQVTVNETALKAPPVAEAELGQVLTSGDTVSVTLGDTFSINVPELPDAASSNADEGTVTEFHWRFDGLPSASRLEDSDIDQGGGSYGFLGLIFASWVIAKVTQIPRIAATIALTPVVSKWWKGRTPDA